MDRHDIYKSKAWKQIRKSVAISRSCICERCGRPVYVSGINEFLPKEKRLQYVVHHKIYLNDSNYTNDWIAYDNSNLELLCIECHNVEHNSKPTKADVMFDEYGQLVPRARTKKCVERRPDE